MNSSMWGSSSRSFERLYLSNIHLLLALVVLTLWARQSWGAGYPIPEPPPVIEQTTALQVPATLSLWDALSLSLRHNPQLNASKWAIRGFDARVTRAGLLPNPRLRIALEDFGGSGDHRGYNVAETTLMLSQLIELGGKRLKRYRLAGTERDLAVWDYEAERLQVAMTTIQAFIGVLADQQRVELSHQILALAEKLHETVSARVKAGEVSRLERYKSRVELARARLQATRAEQLLVTSRQRLAATWGAFEPRFEQVTGNLLEIQSPPDLPVLVTRLESNPDVARWATEMARRQRLLDVAKAATIPDLTIRAGIRQYAENGDVAAVAVFQLPLFIFDNQKTRVDEATAGINQAQYLRRANLVEARRQLVSAYQQLQQTRIAVEILHDEVLPSAKAAFDAVREAYRVGKVGVLDLIDAQRTLFSARRQQVDILAAWHLWRAALERLVGGTLTPQQTSSDNEAQT
ncbi:MAG TPA: TolC family protein [Methylothermaceae bacterium]|nr:TolC family protein [Methylothermaceae bacterium]